MALRASAGGPRGGRWLRAAFLAGGLALAVHACVRARVAERAWSVQLHLHGSFSEGVGSIDSHSFEARDVACDVLWWSDHDFRLLDYGLVAHFGFEGVEEPLARGEAWTTPFKREQGETKGLLQLARPERATVRFASTPVREGEKSLFLATEGRMPDYQPLTLVFMAARALQRRPLAAGISLHLALWPERLDGDARIVVEVQLSEHAPREGLGLEPRFLRYELGRQAGAARREGLGFVVPLACETGRWNELELPVTLDAVRGFPECPGEDNALSNLSFAVEARAGGAVGAYFDDLVIQQRLSGLPVYSRQKELIDEVAALYPGLVELQGLEISCEQRHLNLFCADTPVPDYAALARATPVDPENPALLDQNAFYERTIQWVIEETHRRGGLVSYNHPFGVAFADEGATRTGPQVLAELLGNRAYGADILEVGYRARGGATLEDHLWLWDQAALAGLRLIGTGVSDSHGGPENRWRGTRNNFVSWIWASTPGKDELIAGLRAGRVFFGDLERFDGTLDLECQGARMGATLSTAAREVALRFLATGTQAGQRIVVVESGQRTRELAVQGESFDQELRLTLPGDAPAFVRFELHDAGGPIALSNPIHFLPP